MSTPEKICAKCRASKHVQEFHRASRRVDGLNPYCKDCRRTEEPTAVKQARKQRWYEGHRDQVIQASKARAEADPVGRKVWCADYYKKNSAKVKASVVRWQKSNPHIIAWRGVLRSMLRRMGRTKNGRTLTMLGYSSDEMRSHIESKWTPGMSWANYGEWHIDHIRPLSSFPVGEETQVINALSNLQPLWATTRTIEGVCYEGNLNKNSRWVG